MTRTFVSRMLLVAGTVALVACGPRLKPVEYEEPKGAGTGAPDEDDNSGSSKKKSTSSDSDVASSSGSSGSSGSASKSAKSGPFKSCDDKANTCGSPCTECAAGDQDCMEVLVMKQCNQAHKCVSAPADCSGKGKKKAE